MEIDEFEPFMAEHIRRSSEDRMATDRLSMAEALEYVQHQIQTLLPQGLNTEGHLFRVLLDGHGDAIGHFWLFVGHPREALLYDLFVAPAHRRQGLGRATLAIVDRLAMTYGCDRVWLNVVNHNEAARALYTDAGYETAALHMVKFIDKSQTPP